MFHCHLKISVFAYISFYLQKPYLYWSFRSLISGWLSIWWFMFSICTAIKKILVGWRNGSVGEGVCHIRYKAETSSILRIQGQEKKTDSYILYTLLHCLLWWGVRRDLPSRKQLPKNMLTILLPSSERVERTITDREYINISVSIAEF